MKNPLLERQAWRPGLYPTRFGMVLALTILAMLVTFLALSMAREIRSEQAFRDSIRGKPR